MQSFGSKTLQKSTDNQAQFVGIHLFASVIAGWRVRESTANNIPAVRMTEQHHIVLALSHVINIVFPSNCVLTTAGSKNPGRTQSTKELDVDFHPLHIINMDQKVDQSMFVTIACLWNHSGL